MAESMDWTILVGQRVVEKYHTHTHKSRQIGGGDLRVERLHLKSWRWWSWW